MGNIRFPGLLRCSILCVTATSFVTGALVAPLYEPYSNFRVFHYEN